MRNCLLFVLLLLLAPSCPALAADRPPADLFARDNLVAWCIVPFDAKKRGPEERAAMLKKLGFKKFAYDWRAEHIPTFDAELDALDKQGIELVAWWFPTTLDDDARRFLAVLKRHDRKVQLWVTGGGEPTRSPEEQRQRVAAEVKRLRPIAEAAAAQGCTVGLYNHGGWFGEPENQLAIIDALGMPNVGIVYNQHHGHDHVVRFPQLLEKMGRHLLVLNINGMTRDGDRVGKKILPLAQGELDVQLLTAIQKSGYRGPVGILGHTQDDAEARLRDNLDGLDWLRAKLAGKDPGPLPRCRTYQRPTAPKDHWGPEVVGFKWTEKDSVDTRWKDMDIGRFLASSLPLPGRKGTVVRGLSIRLGDKQEATVCYDTERLKLRAAWTGGFLKFTPARFGLIAPPEIDGNCLFAAAEGPGWDGASVHYRGLHRHGDRVALAYDVTPDKGLAVGVLETPGVVTLGQHPLFTRTLEIGPSTVPLRVVLADGVWEGKRVSGALVATGPGKDGAAIIVVGATLDVGKGGVAVELPAAATTRKIGIYLAPAAVDLGRFAAATKETPLADLAELTKAGPARWTAPIETRGTVAAEDAPYVVDTLTLPFDNPYRALFFVGGHDFFTNGDAAVCTVHGDVWRVSGIDAGLRRLVWKRYATGLFQPLGLRVVNDEVYVLGRDQITRLHDTNGDGEADFYENFCNLGPASPEGHDYTTCLETDRAGNFYFLTAREGVIKVSPDGKQRTVVAGGLRNPNGMGVGGPDDVVTVAPQEGHWTPGSYIAEIRPGAYYGFGGPRVTPQRPLGYDPPLCWIPRRADNSSGGQVWAPPGKRWGPLADQLLHLSFGQCTLLLTLREPVAPGVVQGGTVTLPVTFASGLTRGRFNPRDGQLYVSGLRGWGTAATQDGCLQRVRYTGRPVDYPVKAQTYQNGIALTFSRPLDRTAAEDTTSYSLERWNYRYSENYGSVDYMVSDPKREGHDPVRVKSATLLDARTVFLEIPQIQPVMQLAIAYALKADDGASIRQTLNYTLNAVGPQRIDPSRLHKPASAAIEEKDLRPGLAVRFSQGERHDMRDARLATLLVQAGARATPFLDPGAFRATFSGYLRIPLRGDYLLSLQGQGRALLTVGGKKILEAEGDLSRAPATKVSLSGGLNRIVLDYTSASDGAGHVALIWQGEDFQPEPVPPTLLSHGGADEAKADLWRRRGRELFAARQCARCHEVPGEVAASKTAMPELGWQLPDLSAAGSRLTPEWIVHWLLDPASLRHDARMPGLLSPRDPQSRRHAAALVAFLVGNSKGREVSADSGDARKGAQLFEDLSCASCHVLTTNEKSELYDRISLHYVGAKYRPGMLAAYLLHPQAHHASSRMPDFRLSEQESTDLAAFLRGESKGKVDVPSELAGADAELGRRLFAELRCDRCHKTGPNRAQPGPLVKLTDPAGGCLAEPVSQPKAPRFSLVQADRAALTAFLHTDRTSLGHDVPVEASRRLVKALRCGACHNRDGEASPRQQILEEEGNGTIPESLPNLTWAGEKFRSPWLRELLQGQLPYRGRPTLKTRMPAFPTASSVLARGLSQEHGVDPDEPPPAAADPALAVIGRQLIAPTALDCRQCHALGREPVGGDARTQVAVGIPFFQVRARLREPFFQRFVLDPPRYDVQTKMPKLIPDGRTTKARAFYDGNAQQQLHALWQFILTAQEIQEADAGSQAQPQPQLRRREQP